MDFPLLIRQRLKELGTEQRDLAAAAQVTESYISQLLTGKKSPPAPERTDIYDRMETFLRLPAGKLATLADLVRNERLEEKARGSACALVQGSAGADSPQGRTRKSATHACDVRKGALWRTRTPRHPKTAGRRQDE